jgi:hypothetical protein
MSFTSDEEYGDLLRRTMRAEADSVVPSPEGLDIIRRRIEQRGLRGLFWWRVGASVAGAVLVAGTIVMLVPEFRTQVVESTGISQTTSDGAELPDTSSIKRPPAAATRPPVVVSSKPPQVSASPTSTPKAKPSASASPSAKPDPCVSAEPSPELIEPAPSTSDSCETARTPTPTPTPTPSVTPSPSPSPSTCSGDSCPTQDTGQTSAEPQDPPDLEGSGE